MYRSGASEVTWRDTKALRDECVGEALVAWTRWAGGSNRQSATQRMDHSSSSVLQGARERRGGGEGAAGTWCALVVSVGYVPAAVGPQKAREPRSFVCLKAWIRTAVVPTAVQAWLAAMERAGTTRRPRR